MEPTVSTHFTRAILKTLQELKTPLPASAASWFTSHQDSDRLPLSVLDNLWQASVEASGDTLFGLRAGLNVQPGDLDVVGFLLMSCDSLEEGVDALVDYHRIVGEGGDFSLTRHGGECRLIYSPHYQTCREQRVAAVMASTLAITRWLTDGAFTVKSIHFAHAAPASLAQAQELMGCPLAFDQVADVMVFSAEQLTLPIALANAQVYQRMRALADDALQRLSRSPFSRDVSKLIQQHPAYNKEQIAQLLHLSGRHLNRKLAMEGGSFKLLQDRFRESLAQQLLTSGKHAVDIAQQLGFSDERSFARAFKRWTGATPAQFKISKTTNA